MGFPECIICLFVVINVVTFIIYGVDKLKARWGHRRVAEVLLLLLAVLGGSVGAWLGVVLWRHKTLHWKFRYGIPLILMAQIAVCTFIYFRMFLQ